MIGCADFSQFTDENGDNEMYNALEEYLIDYPEKSRFVLLDDKNYYVWICWYEVNVNE